ncbi:MAG: esterase family protein [Acidimicrobiales bacterium]|nr:esterase family protein [Acidimicrobiales bacterium]
MRVIGPIPRPRGAAFGVALASLVVGAVALAGCASSASAQRPSCGAVPRGQVLVEHLRSAATGGDERYAVYVPPGARPTKRPLPVLVLLHGAGADDTQWLDIGVPQAADCLIARHEIAPMAIVLPDGSRVQRVRSAHPPMVRFVERELLPTVARRHGLSLAPGTLRIGGVSLGASWAMQIAAGQPAQYCAVGGHSGAGRLTAAEARALAAHHVPVYADAGTSDAFGRDAVARAVAWRADGLQVSEHHGPGGHNARYWSHHVEEYLRFYAHAC